MIKPAALMVAVVMVGVTAGTYYGLDMLPPGTLPPPIGRIPPPPPPPIAASPPETVAVASNTAPQAAPAAPAEAPRAAPTEQELAEEPQQQATSPTAAPPPATAPTLHAHVEPAPAPAAAPAPAQTAAAEPAAAPAEAAPTPAPKEKPKAAPKPVPEKPAAQKPAAEKSTEVAKAAPGDTDTPPGPAKPKPPDADVIKPWWPDASKMPENQLKLMYAGQVKGEQALALLFSAPLALTTLQQHAQVKSEGGAAVNGTWELGKNPRLAVFRGLEAGHRYTVVLQPEIADDKGLMLGTTLNGPVYIQAADAHK